jgi:8-oxo-dGTP diphosphatase
MMEAMKPVKRSVAVVVRRTAGPSDGDGPAAAGPFLAVQRPDDPDDPLRGAWGLPAVTVRDGEDDRDAVIRAGRVKLGVELAPGRRIGEKTADRGDYRLRLADYEAAIVSGVPRVPQPDASLTQYTACLFTADTTVLDEAAARGSLCAQIFLEDSALPRDNVLAEDRGRGRLDPA